jgi:hypothetical protein
MKFLRCIILLQLTTALALSQAAQQSQQANLPNQPEALVRSLYQQVVTRHPKGLLDGENKKIFEAYLSQALMRKLDQGRACSVDWDKHDTEPGLKAKAVFEYGLFSGSGVEGEPWSYHVQRTQTRKDGSLRVYVNLTHGKASKNQWSWRVAAVVLRENGHYVIDDVIYINDNTYDKAEEKPVDMRLSGYLSAGCDGPRWIRNSLPNDPEAFVRSFYQQEVALKPVGIPYGVEMKIFAPYLSKTLLHKINLAYDCGNDWYRKNPDPNLKPELAWLELGTFSGGDDEIELRAFQIERTESEKDGSFRVYIRLKWGWPPEQPWSSHVAAVLVEEDGHLVVDDVIFLKDKYDSHDSRLSEILVMGCHGSHWVGYRDEGAWWLTPEHK